MQTASRTSASSSRRESMIEHVLGHGYSSREVAGNCIASHTVIQVSGGLVKGLNSSSVPFCHFAIRIQDRHEYVDTIFELQAHVS